MSDKSIDIGDEADPVEEPQQVPGDFDVTSGSDAVDSVQGDPQEEEVYPWTGGFEVDPPPYVQSRTVSARWGSPKSRALVNRAIVNSKISILVGALAVVVIVVGAWIWSNSRSSGQEALYWDTSIQLGKVVSSTEGCVIPSILSSPVDRRVVRPAADSVQVYAGVGYGCRPLGTVDKTDRLTPLSGEVRGLGESWMLVDITSQDGTEDFDGGVWIPLNQIVPIG